MHQSTIRAARILRHGTYSTDDLEALSNHVEAFEGRDQIGRAAILSAAVAAAISCFSTNLAGLAITAGTFVGIEQLWRFRTVHATLTYTTHPDRIGKHRRPLAVADGPFARAVAWRWIGASIAGGALSGFDSAALYVAACVVFAAVAGAHQLAGRWTVREARQVLAEHLRTAATDEERDTRFNWELSRRDRSFRGLLAAFGRTQPGPEVDLAHRLRAS